MDISAFLKSLEGTSVASSIRNSLFEFPMLESLHVVGLALVFGTIAVLDLRMLGVASRHRPFRRVASDLLKWTWLAFGLTLVTGALMFMTNALVYFHNSVFRAKMILLLLAGVNMAIFELTVGRKVNEWDTAPSAPRAGKIAAVLSLTIWISVIFLGRWIGFTVARSGASIEEKAPDLNFDDIFGGAPQEPAPATPPQNK